MNNLEKNSTLIQKNQCAKNNKNYGGDVLTLTKPSFKSLKSISARIMKNTKYLACAFAILNLTGCIFANPINAMKNNKNNFIAYPVAIRPFIFDSTDASSETMDNYSQSSRYSYHRNQNINLYNANNATDSAYHATVAPINSFKEFNDFIYNVSRKYGYEIYNENLNINFPSNVSAYLRFIYCASTNIDAILNSTTRKEFINNLTQLMINNTESNYVNNLVSYIISSIKYE